MGIKIRTKTEDGITTVSVRMPHPMETGRRHDESGSVLPIHHIRELSCMINDEVVVSAVIGTGISTNPYFSFHLTDANVGDILTLTWLDNLGNTDSIKTALK